MTNPTITHTHGFLDDCDSTTNWTQVKTITLAVAGYVNCVGSDIAKNVTDDGASLGLLLAYDNADRIWTVITAVNVAAASVMAITAGTGAGASTGTFTTAHTSDGDIFTLTITPTQTTDEYMYVEKNITNISTSVYTKYKVRWKTGWPDSIGLKVVLDFTAGSQTIIGETSPEFSTNWTVSSGIITPAKTIDKIKIYADDYPNTVAAGIAGHIYIDYILFYGNDFTFPNCETSRFEPNPKYATIPIPGRVGDDTQNLGSNSAQWHCVCNLDLSNATDDWKRPQGTLTPKDDYIAGQVFDEIAHRSYTEPWQWLDTGNRQFKVTMENPSFTYEGEKHTLDLLFTEKRRRCGSNETYVERFGLNL
jgi:hypothetical protein